MLIKCYGRGTADLTIKLRSRGKRGGDAIVAFAQQHPGDLGMIRNIRIDLGVAEPISGCQWRKLHLQGWVDYCNSATRLLAVGSQPEEPTTIAMSVPLLKQVDNAHLRGFKITPAGAPDRISWP